MKNRLYIFCAFVLTVFLFGLSSLSIAQDIKARFKDRLPQILELKDEGIIGETNQGYLDFVGPQRKMQNVVEAENKDRRIVYEEIAKRENTTVEKVGKRRALQLRDLAASGHFVQDDAGNWYQK
ncbi:MAG: YdbL family protein [Desulfobacterales bacterium]